MSDLDEDNSLLPNQSKIKYNIVDMHWLINNKLYNKLKLEEDPKEAGFLTLGFNADFNNLRVGFYEITESSITRNSINKDKMNFLTSINIFSETANNITFKLRNNQPLELYNLERIIGLKNQWVPNITMISGDRNEITIKTMTPEEKKYMFSFTDYQVDIFLNSLNFMCNGDSWNNYLLIKK
ncbi:MAG: hypothetical protein H7836_08200 [Magnetococcus sp. YQC-3]